MFLSLLLFLFIVMMSDIFVFKHRKSKNKLIRFALYLFCE
jgi:hypothetical protein